MAAALSCNCRLPFFTIVTPLPRKPLKVFCSISPSSPRKFTLRKNYLRQKFLKTLPKPSPNSPTFEPTPADPLIPVEIPPDSSGLELVENEQFAEADFKESSLADASLDGVLGNSPKVSVLQYVMWFFGAFVIYSICVALDIGSSIEYENKKKGRREHKNGVLEVGLNGESQSPVRFFRNDKVVLENGEVIYLDQGEMQKKIEEIQMMAREARAKEKLEGKMDGYESDDEEAEVDSSSKSGIEKEVFDRLVKLSKKLENKLPVAPVDNLKKDVDGRKNLGREDRNEALMFKKKHRFRGFSSRPTDKPKGFTGRIDYTISKDPTGHSEDRGDEPMINGEIEKDGGVGLFDNLLKIYAKDGDSEEDGKPVLTGIESSRTAGNKLIGVSNEHNKLKETGRHKKLETEAQPWWSSLRYVLVILMQGEHDDGHSTGLFTLRNSSSADSDLPHTVAFEDRGDATNFCYLVQSFFEDLEGFSAEVFPVPIKELSERVKSQTMKVIVVKKGQLKLFAGQPLQDVEMALRFLVDQS